MKNLLRLFTLILAVTSVGTATYLYAIHGAETALDRLADFRPGERLGAGAQTEESAVEKPVGIAPETSSDRFESVLHKAARAGEAPLPSFENMFRDRTAWPRSVQLTRRVDVEIYDEGRRVGTIGFPPGRRLEVEDIRADGTVTLASRTSRFTVDHAETNLLHQVLLDRQAELAWLQRIGHRRALLALERNQPARRETQLAIEPMPASTGELAQVSSPESDRLTPQGLMDLLQGAYSEVE